jgi:hypothetical protein
MFSLLIDDRDGIVKNSDEVSLPITEGLVRAYAEAKALGALIHTKIFSKRSEGSRRAMECSWHILRLR